MSVQWALVTGHSLSVTDYWAVPRQRSGHGSKHAARPAY